MLSIVTLLLINPLIASVDTDNNKFLTPASVWDTGPISQTYPGTPFTITRISMHDPSGPDASVDPPAAAAKGSSSATKPARQSLSVNFAKIEYLVAGGTGGTWDPFASADANIYQPDVFGEWDTEMLQLDISGGSMPPGTMLRESPTLVSLGHQTAADMGGGQFHIDSFFDVFTELTLDGGQTWIPSAGSARMTLTGLSPEPGSALLLGVGALAAFVRRRRR